MFPRQYLLLLLAVATCSASDAGRLRRHRRQYSAHSNVGYNSGRADPFTNARPASQFKSCIDIHEIANGQSVCAYSGCRLRCNPGYKFIQTETVQSDRVILDCDHSSGELRFRDRKWTPEMTICSPTCEAACENGGTCVAPNKCACAGIYSGPTCSEEPMLGDQPYGSYQLAPLRDNERRIECEPGTRMPDGSTSVTLQYRDNSWFYPDGRLLLGVDQVTCEKERDQQTLPPASNKPGRPHDLTAPSPHFVPRPASGVDTTNLAVPSCSPPCRNGGECVYVNTCSCPRGYWGPTCEVNSCTYPRFARNLHASLGGTLKRMKFECHPGHRTQQGLDRVMVLCIEGSWRLPSGRLLSESDVLCLPEN
ncbi:neurogenic locus notch homolog protein 1 [Hyalella azteca]|uniref:Neurogenic locus notch homolog protein 1 n=1 Tax=Hyalella azteca TaxID=294128 RepID=A0A8B7NDJ9_HYAAZ|nr:neurogenic locus notch homolog protein 1 [Hyalella azteca]XP_047736372.1 neurogenic locus notch homolog protein 1 [Hyalella azteca]